MPINQPPETTLKTWQKFAKQVRSHGCDLLTRLDDFPDSVLVSGCQRSGGTMLAGIITHSEGMVDFAWSTDDELDAALILSGQANHSNNGRYCFQTTYLNECYREYFKYKGKFKLIWLLRNPHSVVYSLLHNWKRFALNELFRGVALPLLTENSRLWYDRVGLLAVNRLTRACLSYNAKISQINAISKELGMEHIFVIDYDELVKHKSTRLPELYSFIDLEYKPPYAGAIQTSSLDKARKLSQRERAMLDSVCKPVYEELKITFTGSNGTL